MKESIITAFIVYGSRIQYKTQAGSTFDATNGNINPVHDSVSLLVSARSYDSAKGCFALSLPVELLMLYNYSLFYNEFHKQVA